MASSISSSQSSLLPGAVQEDPLTGGQKEDMQRFIREIFFEGRLHRFRTRPGSLPSLAKSYSSTEDLRKDRREAAEILGKERINRFLAAMREPHKTFSLQSPEQIWCAQKYLAAAVLIPPHEYTSEQHDERYRAKLFKIARGHFVPQERAICLKGQLLMKGDSVRSSTGSPLDIVLSRTYFLTPTHVQKTVSTSAAGVRTEETSVTQYPYEETRRVIDREMSKLYDSSEMAFLFGILQKIALLEKLQIFFSSSIMGTGGLGAPYVGRSLGLLYHVEGFYNLRHSIFLSAPVNPIDRKVNGTTFSTFCHEAMHLILNRVFRNRTLPYFLDDERMSSLYKQALRDDEIHRETVSKSGTYGERFFLETMSSRHATEDLAEPIARLFEAFGLPDSLQLVGKIAPNLWKFYQEKIKPCLEQFAEGSFPVEDSKE